MNADNMNILSVDYLVIINSLFEISIGEFLPEVIKVVLEHLFLFEFGSAQVLVDVLLVDLLSCQFAQVVFGCIVSFLSILNEDLP